MKKMILGCLLALCTLSANAQFEAGKKYVSLSSSSLGLSYSKNDKLRFDVGLKAGMFVERAWMVYALAEYNHKQLMYSSFGDRKVYQDEVELGLGGRYYIEQNGLYVGLGLQYGHSEQHFDNFYVAPEIGYVFFINEYLTIEPSLYYHMSLNDFADGSKVGLKLGMGFYF
ncbi:MAG: outer membrane beta-barrel protein [Bacteroidales bacterium]|nr:outer membrane beta-barrel protein [Bacteroidales bacterium]